MADARRKTLQKACEAYIEAEAAHWNLATMVADLGEQLTAMDSEIKQKRAAVVVARAKAGVPNVRIVAMGRILFCRGNEVRVEAAL